MSSTLSVLFEAVGAAGSGLRTWQIYFTSSSVMPSDLRKSTCSFALP